jgi:hypothetical protein
MRRQRLLKREGNSSVGLGSLPKINVNMDTCAKECVGGYVF